MLRPGDILENKYKVLDLIGKGGMSKVWLATATDTNKLWAIKEINKASEAYQREVNETKTLNEIEIMKKIDHPALPRIVSIVNEVGALYVVMDYIEGETLQNILQTHGPQSEKRVANWALQICDIVSYLHSQDPPIIYRDMKPSNVILTPDGKIKIIDFGIAREYKGNRNDTLPLGTQGYASPEHFTKKTDVRSDVYTIGATMYQLLTGDDPTQSPVRQLPSIREINPELSTGLDKIILKATNWKPELRYQTVGELADAIASYPKLEEGYIQGLRKKLSLFRGVSVASIAAIIIGIALIISSSVIDRHNYDKLMSRDNPNPEKRAEEIQEAINIRPRSSKAYLELIEVYARDGLFTEKEASDFLEVFNAHKEELQRDKEEYANISYQIGESFLKYYTGSTDNSSRAKLITAKPYFEGACIEGFDKEALAKGYVFMANYYTDYILADNSLVAKDAGNKEYNELLKNCDTVITELDEYTGEGADKMKQISYDLILNILDTEKNDFANAGIDIDSLMKIVSKILEKSQPLSSELSEQARAVSVGIEITYENKRKEERTHA